MHSSLDPEGFDRLFRREAARAVAALGRVFNDFDRAEDAVQDAYALALDRWPRFGVPKNPAAWILVTARNKAIDRLRRERVAAEKGELLAKLEELSHVEAGSDDEPLDDRLAMIFAACHPALNDETRISLTLRYVAGLNVQEIATALMASPATIAQRLVRAKQKIRRAGIAFTVPDAEVLSERLHDVLHVVYLIFNEGYASATHHARVRGELCEEALRLAGLLAALLPNQAEIDGLQALMLFHDARRATRLSATGEPVLLEDQERSLWDAEKIARGIALLERSAGSTLGPYRLQATIASEHARAQTWNSTNWPRISHCYALLLAIDPSPVVELNRAVAVAYSEGSDAGLVLLDRLAADGTLDDYAPMFSVRAELLRRAQRTSEARAAYVRAVELTQNEPERRYLKRRLAELTNGHPETKGETL